MICLRSFNEKGYQDLERDDWPKEDPMYNLQEGALALKMEARVS